MNTQTKHSLMLMLCAFIWGTAFVAQSAGSGMGAYSFLAGRSWLAVIVLLPTVRAFDAVHRKQGVPFSGPATNAERKTLLIAGLICGTLLFAASAAQQIGITINRSGAGVRAVSGPAGERAALAEHGHLGGRAIPALYEERLWRH